LQVSFYYFEDCPSHEQALERLRETMAEEGLPDAVEVVRVETEDEARRLRFVGSPTIRVDGEDIVPPEEPRYALACRAYRLEDGRVSPLPSKATIRAALASR
jgi:hypothetical protein